MTVAMKVASTVGLVASNKTAMTTQTLTGAVRDMDERVSLNPLDPAVALRGLLITREIEADATEADAVNQSAREYEEGDLDCLADGESVTDAIDSDD